MATYGLSASMILYLTEEYHMKMATASNILFLWTAATNFTPVIGAIIADSYLGRFSTIAFGSIIYIMGTILLWSTTVIPQARPSPCNQANNICSPPTAFQSLVLCASLGLLSIGAGGIRSSSFAFGANQLENEDCHEESSGVSESFFSWYYATYMLSVFIGLTCVVYVQDNMGWKVGFAVPAVLVMFGTTLFFLGSPFYIQVPSKTNLLTGLIQVMVASYRNRHFKLPSDDIKYHCKNGQAPVFPTEKLKFLNKACIVRDQQNDLTGDGTAKDPWRLCTVDQVEELKALLKIVPIWSTGVLMFVNLSQTSFSVLQASSMDRHITSGFTIPAASFSLFTVISVVLWIALYDRVFLPLASRVMGRPIHISTRTRMGIGLLLSFSAMMVTAVVEIIRRAGAIKEGDNQHMSALWLVPPYCLLGFADASTDVAQTEFYFSELPRSMSSIASTLGGVGVTVGNLLASFVMSIVDSISRTGGNESWISNNINKGHYDYYYLVLTGLSLANIVYFLVCIKAYGHLKAERRLSRKEDDL